MLLSVPGLAGWLAGWLAAQAIPRHARRCTAQPKPHARAPFPDLRPGWCMQIMNVSDTLIVLNDQMGNLSYGLGVTASVVQGEWQYLGLSRVWQECHACCMHAHGACTCGNPGRTRACARAARIHRLCSCSGPRGSFLPAYG